MIRNLPGFGLPAQAGIHFWISETAFYIKVYQVFLWIPAYAGRPELDDMLYLKLNMFAISYLRI